MNRVLTQAAELDLLPLGTVVLDNDGDAWQRRGTGFRGETYWAFPGDDNRDDDGFIKGYGPWTVLHVPN